MEYSTWAEQEAYNDGFWDGQESLLDEIMEIVEDSEDRTEACEAIMKFLDEKKKEIESL